ncbi:MAG TPA: hypothetical protein VGR62_05935 [Candidatus Binatia bacterium]|nr:hypothetical protein [Candidatus Binatia bacterium]
MRAQTVQIVSQQARTELVRRAEAGTLVLTVTGGVIRGHTTLLTKQLQTRFGVHVGFNELVADPTVNGRHLVGALAILLQEVERVEIMARAAGIDLSARPIHAAFKVQPYHVTTDERVGLFAVARNNVFSIRDPVRATESIVRGMLEITLLNAVSGRAPAPDLRSMVCEGADLSHVRGPGFASGVVPAMAVDVGGVRRTVPLDPFAQHAQHVIAARDYSSLGDGFVRYFSHYPVLDGPALKRALWQQTHGQLGDVAANREARACGHPSWPAMVTALEHTPSLEFHTLPEVLRAPLRFRRTGWQALVEAMDAADEAGHGYTVVDSLDLLGRPQASLDALGAHLGLRPRDARSVLPYAQFDAGYDGTAIATALFSRVQAEDGVRPTVATTPLPPERLPAFLLPEIARYWPMYLRALRSAHRLRLAASQPITSEVADLEPTSVYARTVADQPSVPRGPVLARLRRSNPSLAPWFDAIDAVA